jgi:hypothetical protein
VAFASRSAHVFASVGADGSVRSFDLRWHAQRLFILDELTVFAIELCNTPPSCMSLRQGHRWFEYAGITRIATIWQPWHLTQMTC